MRIQKMNALADIPIKAKEYDLLEEISKDSMITQSGLSSRLGMAVGSVNWYIKRLVNRGYVKVSHLDRTRLKYDLTPEGMKVFSQRASQYAKDSLSVYKSFRQKAKDIVGELKARGISEVYLDGDDEVMDILRLTCIEGGISVCDIPCGTVLKAVGKKYQYVVNGLLHDKRN